MQHPSRVLAIAAVLVAVSPAAPAAIFSLTVDGTDSIFLAGFTGTPPSDTVAVHPRHATTTPEDVFETLPPVIPVEEGDVVRLADPAIGGVNFFNGFGPPFFGPGGGSTTGSALFAFGGISGYSGPTGPLAGVFLGVGDPTGGLPPPTLDFGPAPAGFGLDFPTLAPDIGQVFYIGDGVTAGGDFQTFIAPAGATRLYLGIPDGFGFTGPPGAYDDNDGSYRVLVGVNEIPTLASAPPAGLLGVLVLAAFASRRRLRASGSRQR